MFVCKEVLTVLVWFSILKIQVVLHVKVVHGQSNNKSYDTIFKVQLWFHCVAFQNKSANSVQIYIQINNDKSS